MPRGFSRYYILDLLKSQPRTGKEIIDCAVEQSHGMWKPSPGLIYPLLGRLLDEGLIEDDDGRYKITQKGTRTAEDIQKIYKAVQKQLDVMLRVGTAGRFVTMEILEKISMMGTILSSNATKMTEQESLKYKKFLQSELERLNRAEDNTT